MAVEVLPFKTKSKATPAQESKLAKYLTAGGAIAGGIIGGMATGGAGALSGAGAGASLGGLAGGMLDPSKAGTTKEGPQIGNVQAAEDSALARKLAASREDRLAVLRQAEAALPQLPPELRQEYAGTIVRATMEEEKRRAMGMGA